MRFAPFLLIGMGRFAFLLCISCGNIGFTEEIVDAGVVEARELDEDCGGNVIFAGFILGVTGLRHAEDGCYLLLCQIAVLSEVADS